MSDTRTKRTIASKLITGVAVMALAAGTALVATGCMKPPAAATVNGEDIPEQQITDYVQSFRETNNLTTDADWAQWLVDSSQTPADVRDNAIDYYIEQVLVEQDAKKHGVSVSDEEVDDKIAETKDYYEFDDEQFLAQIESMGYTEESYRALERQALLQEKLSDAVVNDETNANDTDVLALANSYSSVLDGAKLLSVIALEKDADDNVKSDAVRDAKADFQVAADKYSTTNSFDGWDILTTQDQAVIDAIVGMNASDVSDLVQGEDYDFVVKVDEVLALPSDGQFTALDEIPEVILEKFRTSASATNKSSAFSNYLQELRDNAEITINDMPKDLPYNVSLDGYSPSATEDETGYATPITDDDDDDDLDDGTVEVVADDNGTIEVVSDDGNAEATSSGDQADGSTGTEADENSDD